MTQTDLWQSVAIGLLSVALISYGVILYRFMDVVKSFLESFRGLVDELENLEVLKTGHKDRE